MEGRAGQRVAVTEGLAPGVAGGALLDLAPRPRRRGRPASGRPGRRHGPPPGPWQASQPTPISAIAGRIGPGLGRVVAAVAGGVALGAARLPALVRPGPVEAVAGRRRVAGEDRVPAPGLDVPGDVEGLGAAGLGGDQVLLQRVPAGDADHLEGPALARAVLGLDEPAAALAEEARGDAAVLEARVVEVAENRRLARQRPGERVVRALPGRRLGRMAAGAGGRADVGGGAVGRRGRQSQESANGERLKNRPQHADFIGSRKGQANSLDGGHAPGLCAGARGDVHRRVPMVTRPPARRRHTSRRRRGSPRRRGPAAIGVMIVARALAAAEGLELGVDVDGVLAGEVRRLRRSPRCRRRRGRRRRPPARRPGRSPAAAPRSRSAPRTRRRRRRSAGRRARRRPRSSSRCSRAPERNASSCAAM